MDYNVIQKPELLRAMQRRLGIRGPHVLPVLNEGVQAVVIVDDVSTHERRESSPRFQGWVICPGYPGGLGARLTTCALWNPPESGRRVRIRRVRVSHNTDDLTGVLKPARIDFWIGPQASGAGLSGAGKSQNQWVSLVPANIFTSPSGSASQLVSFTPTAALVDPLVSGVVFFNSGDVHVWEPVDQILDPGWLTAVSSEESDATLAPYTGELFVAWEWEEEPLT